MGANLAERVPIFRAVASKVKALRLKLADVQRKGYELGLKLHREKAFLTASIAAYAFRSTIPRGSWAENIGTEMIFASYDPQGSLPVLRHSNCVALLMMALPFLFTIKLQYPLTLDNV